MDNTERKIVDFMINNSYQEVVHRTISTYILMALSEIQNTLVLEEGYLSSELAKYPLDLQPLILKRIKDSAFAELIKSDRVKKQLRQIMDETARKRDDLVSEIMKQFSLHKDSEYMYIHKKLSGLFVIYINRMNIAIVKADYGYMCEPWKDTK